MGFLEMKNRYFKMKISLVWLGVVIQSVIPILVLLLPQSSKLEGSLGDIVRPCFRNKKLLFLS
jgi:hypothetical protein